MANRLFHETRARKALLRWLAAHETSQAALGKRIGVTQAAVHAWATGIQRPTVPYRRALQRVCGIPQDDWLTAAERRIAEAS